jgi:hypothetical protein
VRIVAMAEWPVNAPGGLPRNYAASTGCSITLASLVVSFTFNRAPEPLQTGSMVLIGYKRGVDRCGVVTQIFA